jgi:class 3 adenylate cyclase/tetratricopeptide (TPR) repeat protein
MIYAFGEYILDTQLYELRRAGDLIHLGPQVFNVLAYLVQHRHRVVPKQELFEHLWPAQFVSDDALERCIRVVRRALGDRGHAPQLIKTIRSRGYRFMAPVEVRPHNAPGDESQLTRSTAPLPIAQAADGADLAPQSVPVQLRSETSSPTPCALEGEHKQVTVLFCALAKPTALAIRLGPEAMHHLMQVLFALAQEVVQQYGGTIAHFVGDGFQALFGAAVAQEDHARRAVLAAVELQQHLDQRLSVNGQPPMKAPAVCMGLHTGVVVIGHLGDDPQRIYTAVGHTTFLASRLQHLAAPGTILMSEATWRLVQDEVHVEPRAAIALEDSSTPVPVYAFCGIAQRRSGVRWSGDRALSRFVGREREMAILHERLAHVESGRGQVVGIAGEPGIGKSRLLYEFRHSLTGKPVTYCEGHCFSYGSTTPYLPVFDLLRQLCGITDVESPQAITAKIQQHLQEVELDPEEAAPYLLYLLGITAGMERFTALGPQVHKVRTFAILRQLSLQSGRRQPLITAVENLHWIDATSEEYLTSLVESLAGAPILLVATYRPGYRPPWLERSYATQLALPGLTSRDSLVVVQSVPQTMPVSDRLRQEIVERAAGNPFFLEELTRAVVEHGDRHPTLVVPDTIQAVLAARIDQLPPEEKRLLQTASVIGKDVAFPLLHAVTEWPEGKLHHALASLQAAEFLYETRLAPDLIYTFKHALTQEVAYSGLLQEQRRALHARIVEALESLAGNRLSEQVERLAYHAFLGTMWNKALDYSRQAGAKAIAGSANWEAVAHFERALVALQHLPESPTTMEQAIDVRCDLRMALMPLDEPGRRLAILREAEALARALDDQRRLGRVSIMITHCLRAMGDLQHALASGHRVLDLATTREDIGLQAMAYFVLGEVYYGLGDYHQAIAMLRRNVEALDQAGSHERFGEPTLGPGLQAVASRCWLIQALAGVGAFAEGIAIAEDALRLAEADGHPYTLALAYARVSFLYLGQGEVHQAIPCLERGLELCRVGGIQQYRTGLYCALSYALALSGRIPEALALLEQTVGRAPAPSLISSTSLHVWVSEVYLRAGHVAEANNLVVHALARAREHKERGAEAWTLRLLGDIAMHRDPLEAEAAEAHYRQALALAEELGMRPLQAHCHLGLGMLYGKIGQLEGARAELSTASELYRAMEMTFWLHPVEAALAQTEGR